VSRLLEPTVCEKCDGDGYFPRSNYLCWEWLRSEAPSIWLRRKGEGGLFVPPALELGPEALFLQTNTASGYRTGQTRLKSQRHSVTTGVGEWRFARAERGSDANWARSSVQIRPGAPFCLWNFRLEARSRVQSYAVQAIFWRTKALGHQGAVRRISARICLHQSRSRGCVPRRHPGGIWTESFKRSGIAGGRVFACARAQSRPKGMLTQ
jgi:hypothetical protein